MSSRTTSPSDEPDDDAAALRQHVRSTFAARQRPTLSLGLEYELFLIGRHGDPATDAELRAFFGCLGGAHAAGPTRDTCVRWSAGDDACSEIKLEHAPHLLEVTVGPRLDLHALRRDLEEVLRRCEAAAAATGTTLRRDHHLGISAADPRVWSDDQRCRDLRAYRQALCEQAGIAPTRAFLNFSATIAAAQLHVGGIAPSELERTIAAAYPYEVALLPFVWGGFRDPAGAFATRWEGYRELARFLPLCGFPRLRTWTFASWLDALRAAPLLASGAATGPAERWRRARDLQLIRPHFQGTLELRADPAVEDLDRLFGVLALRVGLIEHARRHAGGSAELPALHDAWWGAAQAFPARSESVLRDARRALERRGADESDLLRSL